MLIGVFFIKVKKNWRNNRWRLDLTDQSLKLEKFSDKAKKLSIVSISRTCVGL